MSLLAKSGSLYELHRKRGSLRIAVNFYERRHRQLRRAIRRQQRKLLVLQLRAIFQRARLINALARSWSRGPSITENGAVSR